MRPGDLPGTAVGTALCWHCRTATGVRTDAVTWESIYLPATTSGTDPVVRYVQLPEPRVPNRHCCSTPRGLS